jgi:murein DD-endopeptidase MepM/ murein hydrolase activator NlpD
MKKMNFQIYKKQICRILGLTLCTVMLATTLFQSFPLKAPVYADDKITEEDINSLQQMLDALEKEMEEHSGRLEQMEQDEVRLQAALSSYSGLAQMYYEQITQVEARKKECEEKLAHYSEEIKDLELRREEMYKDFKLTLRALRESKDVTILEMIFSAKSLMELLTAVERARDLSQYKAGLLKKMQTLFAENDKSRSELEAELKEQTELGVRLDGMKTEVEGKITETERILTETAQKILETQNTLSQLTETSEEFQKELTDLIRRYEEQLEKERRARQTLFWPLDLKNKRVTSPYGYRYHPLTGNYKFHTGIDLAGPNSGDIKQNNIYAAMDGVVITAVNLPNSKTGYGSYIIISHGYSERYESNVSTLYAHLDSLNVKKGDEVKQGQLIGKVGTTGSSTGYHLHFEVRMNGLTTDPLAYEYIKEIDGEPVDPKTFITGVY